MTTVPARCATQVDQSLSLGPSFYLIFATCTLLLLPLHESAHYLTYRLLGIHLYMTLNTASPTDQSLRKPIAELAGPLLNLVVATVAALAYRIFRHHRPLLAALALSSAMMRLVIYVLVVVAAIVTGSGLSLGNDEPIAAHLWGLPSLTIIGMMTPPLAMIVWSIARTFRGTLLRKTLHLTGLGLTTLVLGILIGNVFDPWLFPNR